MKVLLVRHGEARYDEVLRKGYPHQGYDLGKLSNRGIHQAETVAMDPRFIDADIIISSPYTRALQTAAIISRVTQIPLIVENDLHEWMPDVDFTNSPHVTKSYEDYLKHRGKYTQKKIINWETYRDLSKRAHEALQQYVGEYEKVIVVTHGILMTTFTFFDDIIENCAIREIDVL